MELQKLASVDATITNQPLTLSVKRQIVIDALKMPGVFGSPLTLWEHLPKEKKTSTSTKRTVLRAGIEALKKAGLDIEQTVGDFQNHLKLDDTQMHWIACNCFLKESQVSGADVATRLQLITNNQI